MRLCAGEVADCEGNLQRLEGETCDDIRQSLMAIEAQAAKRAIGLPSVP